MAGTILSVKNCKAFNISLVVLLALFCQVDFSAGKAIPDEDKAAVDVQKENLKEAVTDLTTAAVPAEEEEQNVPESKLSALTATTENDKLRGLSSTVKGLAMQFDLTDEDRKVRNDWGGTCTAEDWAACAKVATFGVDKYDELGRQISSQKNCTDQDEFPPLCLKNRWTVTRCHLFCMSIRCNKGDQSLFWSVSKQ